MSLIKSTFRWTLLMVFYLNIFMFLVPSTASRGLDSPASDSLIDSSISDDTNESDSDSREGNRRLSSVPPIRVARSAGRRFNRDSYSDETDESFDSDSDEFRRPRPGFGRPPGRRNTV